jgi:hypothetical protein
MHAPNKEALRVRGEAMCLLLIDLAGRGAHERIASQEQREDLLDFYTLMEDEEEVDLIEARALAGAFARPWMPASRILWLAWNWTIGMLELPEVWGSVERLAEMLLQSGTLYLYDIRQTCRDIDGLSHRLPKWRRRLHPGRRRTRTNPHTPATP